jgi:hypothetical protein
MMPSGVGIFVSHHHSPEEDIFTHRLVSDLRAAGADVWVDEDSVQSDSFIQRINQGLSERDWFVLVMTPDALGSRWVMREVDAAFNLVNSGQMQSIIPIVAEPCPDADIPPLLRPLQRYDATSDYPLALSKLLRALGLEQAQSPAKSPIEVPPAVSAVAPAAASDDSSKSDASGPALAPAPNVGGASIARVPRRAVLVAAALLLMTSLGGGLTLYAAQHGGHASGKTSVIRSHPTATATTAPSPTPTVTATSLPTATSTAVFVAHTEMTQTSNGVFGLGTSHTCTSYSTPGAPPYSFTVVLTTLAKPDAVPANWTLTYTS